jgi:hypothetical protein
VDEVESTLSVAYGDSSPPSSGTSAGFTGSLPKGEPSLRTAPWQRTRYLASPFGGGGTAIGGAGEG